MVTYLLETHKCGILKGETTKREETQMGMSQKSLASCLPVAQGIWKIKESLSLLKKHNPDISLRFRCGSSYV